jgi:nicotinamide riboside transporter PnuC
MKLSNKFLEYTGVFFSILGTLFIAFNFEYSGYGFVLYLIANTFLFFLALNLRLYGLLVLNIVFSIIDIFALFRWF